MGSKRRRADIETTTAVFDSLDCACTHARGSDRGARAVYETHARLPACAASQREPWRKRVRPWRVSSGVDYLLAPREGRATNKRNAVRKRSSNLILRV